MSSDIHIRELIHSLRNPLTAILANLDMLSIYLSDKINPETKELLDEIFFNVRYLENIMRNASDIVKLKSKNDVLCESFDIKKIIENVIEKLKIIFQNKELIKLSSTENEVIVNLNEDIINRFFFTIFYELLKFNPADSYIKVEISKKDSAVIIDIYFSIEKDDLKSEKIFQDLFILPKNKEIQITSKFIKKVIEIFNGKILIKKERETKLEILF